MRANTAVCPNCGGPFETHRKETQSAGRRLVQLHWVICPACRHVALYDWTFLDEATAMVALRANGRHNE